MEIPEGPFRIDELMERVAGALGKLAAGKDLQIDVSLSPEIPLRVSGDEYRIERTLMGLVESAVESAEKGRISVSANRAVEGELLFRVSNAGIPISKGKRKKSAGESLRADSPHAPKTANAVPGLADSGKFQEPAGGRIWFESEEGEGGAFCFAAKVRAAEEDFESDVRCFLEDNRDDPDYVEIVLNSFLSEMPERLERIRRAVREKDPDRIAHASHKFMALFSAILIESAADSTMELQNAARAGDLGACENLFSLLEEKMLRVARRLRQAVRGSA